MCNATDLIWHSCREQCDLTIQRALFNDPLNVVDKAHAQHFVSFVQHQCFQCRQIQLATTHHIHNAARCTNYNLSATAQSADLRIIR